jgi:MOSC domain-containing protein YiiM
LLKKHHGGQDKAIHHYAFEHYQYWRNVPGISNPKVLREGGFEENISTQTVANQKQSFYF